MHTYMYVYVMLCIYTYMFKPFILRNLYNMDSNAFVSIKVKMWHTESKEFFSDLPKDLWTQAPCRLHLFHKLKTTLP
jgi:hypothetical protein